MKLNFQLSFADLMAAQRLHVRPRRLFRILFYVTLALYGLALVLAAKVWWQEGQAPVFGHLIFYLGFYLSLLYFVVLPWRTKRAFRQQVALQHPLSLEFTDERLIIDAHNGTLRMKWEDFFRWKYNEKLILLYHSARMYNAIPSRAFATPADYSAAVAFLEGKLKQPRP